ncbi:MAG TPA: hypothetical protein VIM31_03180 [Candidatus Microsaccharimonas sp.]
MIAMLRPGAGTPRTVDRDLDQEASLQRKDEARARILGKLIPLGEIFGTRRELREKLGLGDMSMRLFKNGCKYLASRGNDGQSAPRIILQSVGERDRGWRTNDPRPYRMKFIEQ